MKYEMTTSPVKPLKLRGAAWKLLHCQDKEVLISGPAGTGKSLACLLKLHMVCELVKGVRCLIVRRTRESLTESALVTFERFILPDKHPCRYGASRRMRQSYQYPNKSEIVIGGLDKWEKVMSTEYDIIYVMEATENTEDAWEALTTRLRNGVLPYQQIIADCNPSKPTHWLKKRCDVAKTKMLKSEHEDNPSLYDEDKKEWTENGREYLNTLDALTGHRKQRLRYGKWVQAEGAVWEQWDDTVHMIKRFLPPVEWPRYWTIDFGYTNPMVIQWWAQDPDGRLYRYRELYRSQMLVEDAAHIALVYSGRTLDGRWAREPKPLAVICDHDAEGRATFEKKTGLRTTAAFKDVQIGIQAVAARLRPAGDGKPRLFFMRDCNIPPRDRHMAEKKRPQCTEEEIDGYIWNETENRKKGEEPVKENDHGCDSMRYMVAHLDLKRKKRLFLGT